MVKSDIKILYLTRSYLNYGSANYQYDFIKFLSDKFNLHVLTVPTEFQKTIFVDRKDERKSPGVTEAEDKIKNIYKDFDFLMFGHNWLGDSDYPGSIYPRGFEFLKDLNIKKIAFINKEYSRFKDKVNYYTFLNCKYHITHHSDIESCYLRDNIENRLKTFFLPFAVDNNYWSKKVPKVINKKYKLFFSGLLVTPTWNQLYKRFEDQKLRVEIEKKLFFKIYNFRISSKYKDIYWNSFTTNYLVDKFNGYKRLPISEYILKMNSSSVVLNTISHGLISPRTYESLASGSVPFLVESNEYKKVDNLANSCVFFKSDLSNFSSQWEIANEIGQDKNKIKQLIEISREYHGWDQRVDSLEIFLKSLQ